MTKQYKRLKYFYINEHFSLLLFTENKPFRIVTPLPKDVKIVNSFMDPINGLCVVLESQEFPEVELYSQFTMKEQIKLELELL